MTTPNRRKTVQSAKPDANRRSVSQPVRADFDGVTAMPGASLDLASQTYSLQRDIEYPCRVLDGVTVRLNGFRMLNASFNVPAATVTQ